MKFIVFIEFYIRFMNYLNCRWHAMPGLEDTKFKLEYVTKGREVCEVNLKMTDRQFLNRYIKWKTGQKDDI